MRSSICLLAVALVIPSTLTFASEEPFKLGTFEHDGEEIIGVVLRDQFVIDLARANASYERRRPLWVKLPMPADMSELIGRYEYGMRERVHAIVDAVFAVGVYDLVMEAGRKHGIRNAGMYALTSLRIEKGYRAWGHDVTPDDTPLEAGLAFATKLDSEISFNGRNALLRQREAGIERRLVHLMLDDPAVFPLGDEPIVRDGKIIGQVTSAAFGYSLGRAVAMGYVRLDGQDPHQLVDAGGFEIELARERFATTVSLTPYFDPKGARMRT